MGRVEGKKAEQEKENINNEGKIEILFLKYLVRKNKNCFRTTGPYWECVVNNAVKLHYGERNRLNSKIKQEKTQIHSERTRVWDSG